jgi:methanogenic corrinoid protein MtbC1
LVLAMAQFNLDDHHALPVDSGRIDLSPQLLRRGGPRLVGGTTFTGKSALDTAQVHVLAQACLQGLDAARQVMFAWQRQGQSLADIYVQGIAPCARLFGEWWCSDKLDFAMTTIVSSHLQQLLHDFSAEFLQEDALPRNGWSLLLVTEPGAQHSMGLFMLSEFFKQAGWTVTIGLPQDTSEFQHLCQTDWFDAVGVSISTDRHLQSLAVLMQQIKDHSGNPNMCMFLGGPMALRESMLLKDIPAEVVAEDAPATVQWLTQRVTEAVSAGHQMPSL